MPVNAADAAYEAQRRQRLQSVLSGMDAEIAAEDEAAKPKEAPVAPEASTPEAQTPAAEEKKGGAVDAFLGYARNKMHKNAIRRLQSDGYSPEEAASQADVQRAEWEKLWTETVPNAVGGGIVGGLAGMDSASGMLFESVGMEKEAAEAYASANKFQEQLDAAPVSDDPTEAAIQSGIQSFAQLAPYIAVAWKTRQPGVALGAGSAMAAGQANLDAMDSGKNLSKTDRLVYSASVGLVEYATEKLPMETILGSPAGKSLTRRLLTSLAQEQVGEQVATFSQDFLSWRALHPEKTVDDYMNERPMAAYQTAIATLIGSGLTNTAITAADAAGNAIKANTAKAPDAAPDAPTEPPAGDPTPEAPAAENAPQEPAAAQEAEPEAEADTFEAQAQRMQDAIDAAAAEVGETTEIDAIIDRNPDVQGMAPDDSTAASSFEAEYNALLGLAPKALPAPVVEPAAEQDPAVPGPQTTPFRAIFGEQAAPTIVEQAEVAEIAAVTEATTKKYFGRKSFGGQGLTQTETEADVIATPEPVAPADETPALLSDDEITRIADRETVEVPEAADAESMLTLAEANYDEVVGKDMLTALDDQFDYMPKQVREIMDAALDGEGSTKRFNTLMKRVAKIRSQMAKPAVQEDFKALVAQQPEAGEGGLGRSFQSLVDEAKDPKLARGDHLSELRDGMTQRRNTLHLSALRSFGQWYAELAKTGRIGFVSDMQEISPELPVDTLAVTSNDGRVLINDNVLPEIMEGLILHELGIHAGLGAIMGFRGRQAILDSVERLVQSKDASAVVARERAQRNSLQPQHIAEETLAYLVQYAPRSPIVTRAIATMKVWLARRFPAVIGRLNWTTADFRQLALLSIRHQAYRALELPVIFRRGLEGDGTTLVLSTPRTTLTFGNSPSPRLLERVRSVIDLKKPQDFQQAVAANAEDLTDPNVMEALFTVHPEFDPFLYQDLVEQVANTGDPDAAHDLSKLLEPLKGMDIPLDVLASRDENGFERPVGFDDEAARGNEPFSHPDLTDLQNRVVEKALNGFSNAEIAEIEDSTVDSVANMLSVARRIGIQIPVAAYKQAGNDRLRIEGLIDSGLSNKVIAERTGKTTNHVAQVRFQMKKRVDADMAMDDASRLARAASLGFDTGRTLYHGTPNPIQGDVLRQSRDGLFGAGIYLTRNEETARTYATGGEASVIPLYVRGRLASFEDAKAARTMAAKQVGNVMNADQKIAAVTQQLLQNAGFSGVEAGDTVTMFDFKDVRSTEARFDPRRDGQRGFMLARGDAQFETPGSPEYQEAVRKGLDMSTEARMERAQAMGFDTDTVLYHGTGADIAGFRASQSGTRGRGIYLTPKPDVAAKYAVSTNKDAMLLFSEPGSEGAVMPTHIRGKIFPDESSSIMSDADFAAIVAAADPSHQAKLRQVFEGDGAFPKTFRKVIANAAETEEGRNALLEAAGFAGRSGRSQITADAEIMIFDPKNIRSVHAAFDPDLTTSPNLLASRSDGTQSDMFDPYADPDVYVNLARVEGPEDFRALVQELANKSRDAVNEKIGRKRTLDQVEREAAGEEAFNVLMKRRKGNILNDREMLALRQLRDASATKIREIAAVVEQNPSRAAKAALHRALILHRTIQAEVSGASADASRLLGSLRIMSKAKTGRIGEINDALDNWATEENVDELVKRIGRLGKNQEVELDDLLHIGFKQAWTDLGGAWIRAMFLSNPKTHGVNALGNMMVQAMDVGSTFIGGALTFDQQMMSEAGIRAAEMTDAFYHQFRYMAKHSQLNPLKEGTSVRFDDMNVSGRQVDAGSPRALSAGRVNSLTGGLLKNPSEDSIVGRTINLIGYGIAAPSEALGVADDMFKGVNYRVEMRALAWRQANAELRDGRISKDELAQRVEEIIEEPTDDMVLASRKAAQERTFTNRPGPLTMGVLRFRRALNNVTGLPIGHLLLPFVITPSNIFSYTFRHLPTAGFFPEWRADYQAGGPRRARAVGQVAMGTSVMMLGMSLGAAGVMMGSGPDDREKRRLLQENQGLGFQPFSIRAHGHTYTVDRLDPVSSMLLIGAELNEIWANKGWDSEPDDQFGDLLFASAINIGRMMLEKSYMTGVRDFIRALEDENFAKSYFARTSAAVTTPAVGAEVRRQVDPFWREADTAITAIKNRIPTLSSELPMEYDMFGRPKVYQSGHGVVYDSLMPFIAKKVDPEPIDNELLRLKFMPSQMDRSLGVPVAGQRIPVNLRDRPDIYSRMTQLMGGDKELGLPSVMDKLNILVSAPGYGALMDGPQPLEGSKAAMIRDVITEHRSLVRQIVTQEYWGDLQKMGRDELGRMMERTAEQEEADQSAMAEATMRALAQEK